MESINYKDGLKETMKNEEVNEKIEIVDFGNKDKFLVDNGFDDEFYFDGSDLVHGATGRTEYRLADGTSADELRKKIKSLAFKVVPISSVEGHESFETIDDVEYCDVNEEGAFQDDPGLVDEFVDAGFVLKGSKLYIPKHTNVECFDGFCKLKRNGYTFDVGEWPNDDNVRLIMEAKKKGNDKSDLKETMKNERQFIKEQKKKFDVSMSNCRTETWLEYMKRTGQISDKDCDKETVERLSDTSSYYADLMINGKKVADLIFHNYQGGPNAEEWGELGIDNIEDENVKNALTKLGFKKNNLDFNCEMGHPEVGVESLINSTCEKAFGELVSDIEKVMNAEKIEEYKEFVKRSNRKDKSSKKDKVIVFGKDTKLKEEARKIPYGLLAWQLNEIISGMNNEEAYYGSWLYVWPDGEDRQGAIEDFETKEEYEELEDLFKKVYKAYHRDGLYNVSKKVLDRAHKWDKKLGLKPIVDVKYEKPNKFEDDLEEKIGEELTKAGIDNDAFEIEEERDNGADYSYKTLYFYDNSTAKKAFNALKNSQQFVTVTTYVEPFPDDIHSSIEVIVSEHKEEGEDTYLESKPLGLKSFSDTADVDTAYGLLNNGERAFGGNWDEKEAYSFLKNNNVKLPYTDNQLHQIAKEWCEYKKEGKE